MIEKKDFHELLDADGADHVVRPHAYINCENLRYGSSEKEIGYMESIGSTVKLANPYLPTGTNTTIGACEDESRKYILEFNFNSTGEHGIYCYDRPKNLWYKVLLNANVTDGLNFDRNHLIVSRIIGGILYFTDNYNEPRKVKIGAGLGLYGVTSADFDDSYSYVSPINQWVISDIRKPPMLPPTFIKTTSTALSIPIASNQVKNFAGQFAWLYDYKDNERSVLSPVSKLANYNKESDTYDVIVVSLPLMELIEQDVQKVTLVVFGTDGIGFEIKTWDKNNSTDASYIENHNLGTVPLSYNFLNDQTGIALDAAYSVKPFDSVPLLALALERAKNRKFYGNYLIGYNTPTLTSLQLSTTATGAGSLGAYSWTKWHINIKRWAEDTVTVWTWERYIIYIDAGANPGWYILTGATGAPTQSPFSPASSYAIGDFSLYATTLSELYSDMLAEGVAHHSIANGYIQSSSQTDNGSSSVTGVSQAAVAGDTFFKSDSAYKFGIVFYDFAGRKCGVLTNESMRILIPTRIYNEASFTKNVHWVLDNTDAINEIPDWAYYYQIVRTRSLQKSFFIQVRAKGRYAIRDVDGTITYQDTYSSTAYGIGFNIQYLQSLGMGYTFQEGDIASVFVDGTAAPYNLSVIGQDGNYVIIQLADLGTLDISQPNIMIELYSPYKESMNEPLYEIGEVFKITDPTLTTRSYSVISGTISGDVTLKSRGLAGNTEVMNPNDTYWRQWNTDISKPNIIDSIGQRRKTHHIKFSNILLPGTRVNGLSTYDALDEQDVPVENGPIQCLRLTSKVSEDGTVMLSISENETASVYLGEATLSTSAGGSAFIAKAEGVIGQINTLKGSHGTIHPESVVEFRGNVYWFDANSGEFVQYSINGLDSLSKYKLKRFSKNFAARIKVLSEGQEYVIGDFAFQDVLFPNGQTHKTIVFTNAVTQQPSPVLLAPVHIIYNYWNGLDHVNPTAVIMQAGQSMIDNSEGTAIPEFRSSEANTNFTLVAVVNTENYRPKIFGGIDSFHREVLWSLPYTEENPNDDLEDYEDEEYPFDFYDGAATTIIYKIDYDRFMTKLTMAPEMFSAIGDELYCFKGGILYRNNDTDSYNNFFGTQYKSRIMAVCNMNPSAVKVFKGFTVESNMAPTWVYFYSEYPFKQSSDLIEDDFDDLEGIFYADILRDRLTPGAVNYERGRKSGDKMRSSALRFLIEFTVTTTPAQLKYVNIDFNESLGHRV